MDVLQAGDHPAAGTGQPAVLQLHCDPRRHTAGQAPHGLQQAAHRGPPGGRRGARVGDRPQHRELVGPGGPGQPPLAARSRRRRVHAETGEEGVHRGRAADVGPQSARRRVVADRDHPPGQRLLAGREPPRRARPLHERREDIELDRTRRLVAGDGRIGVDGRGAGDRVVHGDADVTRSAREVAAQPRRQSGRGDTARRRDRLDRGETADLPRHDRVVRRQRVRGGGRGSGHAVGDHVRRGARRARHRDGRTGGHPTAEHRRPGRLTCRPVHHATSHTGDGQQHHTRAPSAHRSLMHAACLTKADEFKKSTEEKEINLLPPGQAGPAEKQ